MNKDLLPRPVTTLQINKHFFWEHMVLKKSGFSGVLLLCNSQIVVKFCASLHVISFLKWMSLPAYFKKSF